MTVTTASEMRDTGRPVVVTAFAAITSIADDVDGTWEGLLRNRSGIGVLDEPFVDHYDLPVRIGGKLTAHPAEHLSRVEQRRLSFVEQSALVLGRRAWASAGSPDVDGERLAVAIGTGLGGGDALVGAVDAMRANGYRKVSPMSVPMVMPNGPAATVGLEIGAKAGVFAPVSACSSGSEAIAHAWRLIATGEADVVVAGGVEGQIDAVPIASFAMMRAMSTRNDEPARASRPFDRDRDGFVFGEAGAVLVLESEEHARSRGAEIHGRILGAGITSDAHHIVAPDPQGAGIARAMRKALDTAGLSGADVDHVNAHATSTSVGDASEATAIAAVAGQASVYAPKSALGHSIGAVGALEAILTVLTVREQIVPPTLNLDNQDPAIDLDVVAGSPRRQRIDYALSNSIGFGGHNVALAVGRY
ncbi:beta-ketoacyl-[acyl-carrier-protein] synthase II [Rhodococcus sp. SC4]|uniref:KasA/KasB family beta-ketoacyl-ACP synthase n=1 Tax=unclassified Rhodococcus (in: high G+C Gram-positive bacteria) TaxID=192944 RepID=UPI000769B957|nr:MULTISPECIES: KasA/KasB family beta-ketoacyl-ACP synthase [unclassified Rhodococcus (in: high G+C Gram-positive bacteria)]KXF53597.1 beta-ketoacyl-[acyl-carrier-protein] synthase II [Rhodococcus sp. SC4]KXX54995.1 beta-ketoacyl-[acyl-carrier-protein] synthase II [Rhodococcus sp. LB1]PBC49394.1 beta-ketoacyl-[acyl-carrier-protein] synthase II [Rhodococcus sp. ACPA1]RZK72271.1 MAG: beta-ketoacyl-ACP synthase [Rhodococcus sp. (in: high G+C Gram-positive bacteria)]